MKKRRFRIWISFDRCSSIFCVTHSCSKKAVRVESRCKHEQKDNACFDKSSKHAGSIVLASRTAAQSFPSSGTSHKNDTKKSLQKPGLFIKSASCPSERPTRTSHKITNKTNQKQITNTLSINRTNKTSNHGQIPHRY